MTYKDAAPEHGRLTRAAYSIFVRPHCLNLCEMWHFKRQAGVRVPVVGSATLPPWGPQPIIALIQNLHISKSVRPCLSLWKSPCLQVSTVHMRVCGTMASGSASDPKLQTSFYCKSGLHSTARTMNNGQMNVLCALS